MNSESQRCIQKICQLALFILLTFSYPQFCSFQSARGSINRHRQLYHYAFYCIISVLLISPYTQIIVTSPAGPEELLPPLYVADVLPCWVQWRRSSTPAQTKMTLLGCAVLRHSLIHLLARLLRGAHSPTVRRLVGQSA